MDFNLALDKDEADECGEHEMALQTMPHPQLLTTGLERGDILALLINAVVAEVAMLSFCWLLVVELELLLLLVEEYEDDDEDDEKV